jgi:hypothetical protein
VIVHVAASAEVEVEVGAEAVEFGAEGPVGEGPVGEASGLCVAEQPATATITALMVAAATVALRRDMVVMGGCPSLNPRTPTLLYGTEPD